MKEDISQPVMNNSKWFGIGIVILILVVAAYFIGQNSNNQPKPTSTLSNKTDTQSSTQPPQSVQGQPQSQTPTPQPSYTTPSYYTPMAFSAAAEAQRSSWDNGCTSKGTNLNYCNCTFDYLIYNYGVIWLIQENAYINVNGAASPEFRSESQSASQYCSAWNN